MRTVNSRRYRILGVLVALPLAGLVAAAGAVPAVAAPRHRPDPARAVALGDSFAAGEGLRPYADGTDTATNRCHRSAQAYPALLADSGPRRFSRLTSVACSGARSGALVAAGVEPAQLAALSRRTRTVTLTIGGNDIGFAAVLGNCIYTPVVQAQALVPGRPGCASRLDGVVTAATARLAGRAGSAAQFPGTITMPQALRAIHRQAPKARVYVTGYPRLFGLSFPSPAGCPVGTLGQIPLFVTANDARWIRRKADGLNDVIAAMVARARREGIQATYVDVATPFTSHNVCGTGTRWVNGVVADPTSPSGLASASFHPTAQGQQAYADAVAAAARPRT